MRLPYPQGHQITEGTLYRRIPPWKDYWVTNPTKRPSGLDFIPDTGEVYVSTELKDPGEAEETQINRILAAPEAVPGSGIFEIDVEVLSSLKLTVRYEPEWGDRHFGIYGWEQFGSREIEKVRRSAAIRSRAKRDPVIPERTT